MIEDEATAERLGQSQNVPLKLDWGESIAMKRET
jgi:hypothetical protein